MENLIAQDGLKLLSDSISKLRTLIKCIRQPAKKTQFESILQLAADETPGFKVSSIVLSYYYYIYNTNSSYC